MGERGGGSGRPQMDNLSSAIREAINCANVEDQDEEEMDFFQESQENDQAMKRKLEEEPPPIQKIYRNITQLSDIDSNINPHTSSLYSSLSPQAYRQQASNLNVSSPLFNSEADQSINGFDRSLSSTPLNNLASTSKVPNSANSTIQSDQPPDFQNRFVQYFEKCKGNRYYENDIGPFVIFIDKLKRSKVQAMTVGKIIRINSFELYKDIKIISKISNNRFKIILASPASANKLLAQPYWEKLELGAYIPNFVLFRQGVIRDVDESLSEEEILENVQTIVPIVKVKRIKVKIEGNLTPIRTVILTFRGQYLPNEIKIFGVNCQVKVFIQKVIQCYQCLGWGHTSNSCRKTRVCESCAGDHPATDACQTPLNCYFCKGNHKATSKSCPEYIKQKNIKQLMAEENVSFEEAKQSLLLKEKETKEAATYAQRLVAPVFNVENFPMLKSHNSNSTEVIGRTNPPQKKSKSLAPPHYSMPQNISNNLNLPSRPILSNPHYNGGSKAEESNWVKMIVSVVKTIIPVILKNEKYELSSEQSNLLEKLLYNSINFNPM